MSWQTKFPNAVLNFPPALTEQALQQQCRAVAGYCNAFLGRNNTGAYSARKPPTPGTRWGWCNDSAKTNAVFKTPDLIGYASVVIEPHHVGRTMAVFVGAEVKDPNWHRYLATNAPLHRLIASTKLKTMVALRNLLPMLLKSHS